MIRKEWIRKPRRNEAARLQKIKATFKDMLKPAASRPEAAEILELVCGELRLAFLFHALQRRYKKKYEIKISKSSFARIRSAARKGRKFGPRREI